MGYFPDITMSVQKIMINYHFLGIRFSEAHVNVKPGIYGNIMGIWMGRTDMRFGIVNNIHVILFKHI